MSIQPVYTKQKNNRKMRRKLSCLHILLISSIFFFVLGFSLYKYFHSYSGTFYFLSYEDPNYRRQELDSEIDKLKLRFLIMTIPECEKYGYGTGSVMTNLLDKYVVKKGDTFSSIDREKLGYPNAVNDLITINMTKYPALLEQGLLEIGWELYLPKEELSKYIYNGFWTVSGNYYLKDNDQVVILGPEKELSHRSLNQNISTLLEDHSIKEKDCVTIYSGKPKPKGDVEVYLIQKQ